MTRLQSIAMLSALLAQHYGPKKISAFNCAELAIELTSIANGIVNAETFATNGYKNERQDEYLNKLSRSSPAEANKYSAELQQNGAAYVQKRRASLARKLARVLAKHELPTADFEESGLYGGVRFVADGREWSIAA